MRLRLWGGAVAAVMLVVAAGGASAQTLNGDAASALVVNLTHDAVARLGTKGLSRAERSQIVRDLLARYSNEKKLAEQVLGRSWTSASAEEKTQFEDRLTEYLVAICAGMLKDLSPDTKVIVRSEETAADRIVVHTLVKSGDDPQATPVDWSVALTDDGHLFLADAAAEGVSLVRTMSSDFHSVLFANGGRISALVAAMNRKIGLVASTD